MKNIFVKKKTYENRYIDRLRISHLYILGKQWYSKSIYMTKYVKNEWLFNISDDKSISNSQSILQVFLFENTWIQNVKISSEVHTWFKLP